MVWIILVLVLIFLCGYVVYKRQKNTNEGNYMYCNKCGKKIPRNSKFCNKCGNKIEIIF